MNINKSNELNFETKLESVKQLAKAVKESECIVKKKIGSWRGHITSALGRINSQIPKWAEHHISITRQFEVALKELADLKETEIPKEVLSQLTSSKQLEEKFQELESKTNIIPSEMTNTLRDNQQLIFKLLKKVAKRTDSDPFIEQILKIYTNALNKNYVGPNRLLETSQPTKGITKSSVEWHLNLGLLMNVYKKTEDPKIKQQISFLALNYLAKAAPINIAELNIKDGKLKEDLESLFQFGLFQSLGTYYRDVPTFENFVRQKILASLPSKISQETNLILTDTKDLTILLPTRFSVLPNKGTPHDLEKDWSQDLAINFAGHLDKSTSITEAMKNFLDPPIILDLTSLLGDIQIKDEKEKANKNLAFENTLNQYEEIMARAISSAVKTIKQKYPAMIKTPEDELALEAFIRTNIICICTSEVNDVSFIKALPMFHDPKMYQQYAGNVSNKEIFGNQKVSDKEFYTKAKLEEFVNLTGSRLGAINGRQKIFNFLDIQDLVHSASDNIGGTGRIVEYTETGSNILYFKDKLDITKSILFQNFENHFEHTENLKQMPDYANVLGQATAQLIKGVLTEISEQKWIELNANPHTRQILQSTLFRLTQHLAEAENQIPDFGRFSQAIELIHTEMATLLTLFSPFKETDFNEIYKKQLNWIPTDLAPHLKIGITKSAMNAFAGINAIIKQEHPDIERVYGFGSYYEEVGLIGENRTTDEILQKDNIKRVDLYVGEFNHNIIPDQTHSKYYPGSIETDIEALLKDKQHTQQLTIAIDCTIDYIHSEKVKNLLEHFSKEIKDGKLNFIFFRSGQKFDMLGMDNYYGGTFYTVNNGDKKWEAFNLLTTHNAFKGDTLSQQWFCLVNKYAPGATDAYRHLIFENTRKILNKVPEILKPGGNAYVKVCEVDKDVHSPFIDIKILNPAVKDTDIELLFHQTFNKYKTKIFSRGSFGFYHPNINIIPNRNGGISIRFNPGIDAKEINYVSEVLNNIALKVEKLEENKI